MGCDCDVQDYHSVRAQYERLALSDDQVEHQMSFMRFLGLGLEGRVPDAKTVEALFETFDGYLKDQGYLAMGGQIIDASIVAILSCERRGGARQPSPRRYPGWGQHGFGCVGGQRLPLGGDRGGAEACGTLLRSVRAKARIGLKNLAYNITLCAGEAAQEGHEVRQRPSETMIHHAISSTSADIPSGPGRASSPRPWPSRGPH